MQNFEQIVNEINQNQSFKIITHKNPDLDAIGSVFALGFILKKLNKNVSFFLEDYFINKCNFLNEYFKELDDKELPNSTIISVDCASLNLLAYGDEKNQEIDKKIDICIDHHKSNLGFGKINLIIPGAASNTIIVFKLLNFLKLEIDEKISQCILVGILTDTGSFKNSNTNSEAFEVASLLFSNIKSFENLIREIFNNKSKDFFKFKNEIFNKTEFFFNNKCAITVIKLEIMEKFKINYNEINDCISIPLEIKEILVNIIIKEKMQNLYKVSIRTKGEISACKICSCFGGGGHENASGFEIHDDIKSIVQKILIVVRSFL